jgi:hypothetical protein
VYDVIIVYNCIQFVLFKAFDRVWTILKLKARHLFNFLHTPKQFNAPPPQHTSTQTLSLQIISISFFLDYLRAPPPLTTVLAAFCARCLGEGTWKVSLLPPLVTGPFCEEERVMLGGRETDDRGAAGWASILRFLSADDKRGAL